jgi:hypothetical protein
MACGDEMLVRAFRCVDAAIIATSVSLVCALVMRR